jgi:hypothetical protein
MFSLVTGCQRMKRVVVVLTALAQASPACADKFHDDLQKLTTGLPKDVRAFIERRAECNHWQGEEAHDRPRAREIDRAIKQLKCDSIARDDTTMRARYADKPDIIKAMDAAAGF